MATVTCCTTKEQRSPHGTATHRLRTKMFRLEMGLKDVICDFFFNLHTFNPFPSL
jgi:hypothetical protein